VLVRDWWIERSSPVGNRIRASGSPSWYLFLAAVPGMATPMFVALTFQPSAAATLLIAGVHFWSLVFVWLALILDRLDLNPTRGQYRVAMNHETHAFPPASR
jgi:hypothetical protein